MQERLYRGPQVCGNDLCTKAGREQDKKKIERLYRLLKDPGVHKMYLVLHPTRPNLALMANVTGTLFWPVERRWNRSKRKTARWLADSVSTKSWSKRGKMLAGQEMLLHNNGSTVVPAIRFGVAQWRWYK